MRVTTLLRKVLFIQHLIVRDFEFDDRGIVIGVAPTSGVPRCGECGSIARRIHDQRQRFWRHLDLAGMMTRVRYSIRRVHCPKCERVKTEQVSWADASCNFTYAFEERTAFLAQQCSKTAVTKLMRFAWRTVGEIETRTVSEFLDKGDDRIDGLRQIGADELSYRCHHKYVTTVVNHELGIVVWAKEGKNAATLRAFFEELARIIHEPRGKTPRIGSCWHFADTCPRRRPCKVVED
ncbi:MAG: transposase, partial [Planctomycetota bacterium]